MSLLTWRKSGAVSYSFSCSKAMTIYKAPNVCWDARLLQSIFKFVAGSRACRPFLGFKSWYLFLQKSWRNKKGQMFVWMLVFCNLFLQQAADSNSKKDCKNQVSQQTFGSSYFVKALNFIFISLIMPIDSILLCKNWLFYFRQIQKIPRYSLAYLSFLLVLSLFAKRYLLKGFSHKYFWSVIYSS